MEPTYNLFDGPDLMVAEKILQRRAQMLVHSCLYYEFDNNIIPDTKWDEWAKELVQLQKEYPEISEKVRWYEYFKDWDASTGAFLPLKDEWVIKKAKQISQLFGVGVKEKKKVIQKPKQPEVKKPSPQKVLF